MKAYRVEGFRAKGCRFQASGLISNYSKSVREEQFVYCREKGHWSILCSRVLFIPTKNFLYERRQDISIPGFRVLNLGWKCRDLVVVSVFSRGLEASRCRIYVLAGLRV